MIDWDVKDVQIFTKPPDGYEKVVMCIGWVCAITDNEYVAFADGRVVLPPVSEEKEFTPFYSLTKQKMLEWVWNNVDRLVVETSVKLQLDNLINPVAIYHELPWKKKNGNFESSD